MFFATHCLAISLFHPTFFYKTSFCKLAPFLLYLSCILLAAAFLLVVTINSYITNWRCVVFKTSTAKEEPGLKPVEIVNEDVIRCVCGEEADEGYMLQCDVCLTWQHATCEGIAMPGGSSKSDFLPEYVCIVCRDPPGIRE